MCNSLSKYCFQILRVYFGFFGDKKASAILKERSVLYGASVEHPKVKFKLVSFRSYDRNVWDWMRTRFNQMEKGNVKLWRD